MDVIRNLATLLNKPFPEDESRFGKPKAALIVSIFITFFLIIFTPFGISALGSDRYWVCIGFGAVTFFSSLLYEYLFGHALRFKAAGHNWTYGKWMIYNLGMMLFISLANFLFARLAVFGYIIWSLLPDMIYGTFMVGIIPVVGLGAFALLRSERNNLKIAADMNAQRIDQTQEHVEKWDTLFDIPLRDIRYIEALQNYVKIGFINSADQYTFKSERATLKQILADTERGSIVKCHRSFLVNRSAIISTEGNAQGLLLTLTDCPTQIPVSRSFIKTFRQK